MTFKHLRLSLVLIFGLSIAACATTDTAVKPNIVKTDKTITAASQKVADSQASDEEDPMICETVAITGQIRPKKVCIRESVREARRKDAKDSLSGIQRNALSSCIPNASGQCGG